MLKLRTLLALVTLAVLSSAFAQSAFVNAFLIGSNSASFECPTELSSPLEDAGAVAVTCVNYPYSAGLFMSEVKLYQTAELSRPWQQDGNVYTAGYWLDADTGMIVSFDESLGLGVFAEVDY